MSVKFHQIATPPSQGRHLPSKSADPFSGRACENKLHVTESLRHSIMVSPSPFGHTLQLTPAHSSRIHDLLKSQKSRKWPNFDKNDTSEALDEWNQYTATSRSHWEGSRTLKRGPGPQKLISGPKNWGRWHGEAFKSCFRAFLLGK